MAQKKIDIGVQGNDGTGDSIRTSFQKVNDNFSELYAIFGGGGTIRFTNLADAPASYKANQIIMAATTGGGLTARDIVVGAPAIQFSIDATSDNTKLIIHPPTSSLSTDQNPTLGGNLNAQGAYSVVNLADPSEALVQAFNNNNYNKTNNITTTLASLAVTKGYADANYLKVSKGQITSALNVRTQPLTPQVGVTGYDPTLTGNYLSTEAMQRKDVVYRGGDTMTGALNLSDHPSPLAGEGIVNDPEDLQAATKYYVDNSTYYSGVNLYVTTKGDDLQTHTPAGREGRAWQYAYATVGKAALQAENLISLSNQEPGPYRQTLSYTIGANQFNGYVYNAPATQSHLVGLIAGSSAVQGVLDAASLLEYNRSFIQQETISYINKKYVNKSTFDQTRWESIISNIINGVAYDLALNTTFNSMTQASILFNSYNADIITNELSQVRDAVAQIQKQILEYSYDSNSGTALQNYLHRILFALSYDFAIGSNYQSIQAGLLFPYANNSVNPNAVPDFSANEIVSLLDTSSITITNAIGNGTTATITFDEQLTVPFQVNEQILITGVSTSGYNSSSSLLGYWTVLSCDTTYITFACTTQVAGTGGSIVRNNLINNLIASVGVASITTSLQSLAETIVKIILTGQTPTPSFPATSSSLSGSFSAANLLVNNIPFIQAEISGFLTSKYSNVGYDKSLSRRDIQAIVWSLVYDLMYGGNSQSTYAANRYWYGGVQSPHLASNAQQSACIDAIDYIGVLAQNIITNSTPNVLYQTTVFQYTNETYAGGSVASSSISGNIALIASILSGSGVVAENSTTGLYGTAPTIPGSAGVITYDKFNLVIHNPTTNGPIPTIILTSVGYIKAINGLISNSLLGTVNDGPTVNTISAKFNVIQNLLRYGVNNSVQPRGLPYYTNSGSDFANQAKAAIFANVSFLQANINSFIVNTNSGIVFDQTASARDISAILEAVCYDLLYGGNSATVQAALQYYANGTLQLAAGRNTSPSGSCYTAISELREEVVQILKNQYVAVQSGNTIIQTTPQPVAWGLAYNAENQIRGSFSLILDVLANYTNSTSTTVSTLANNYVITYPTSALGNSQGTSSSQSLLLINSDTTKGPLGAWNIITGANSSITSYVYNYLETTYTGGLTYNEATCLRDIGLMIDAVVIDILTGTSSVPANYQTVQAGKSYYRNASALKAITGDQLAPTTQAISFIQSLAAQVLNQTQELRFQSLVTQNAYHGATFSIDGTKATTANSDFAGAVAQVNGSFTTILQIIEKGLSAAPTAVQGSGYYGIRVYNGGVGSVDQGQAADNHIIPGKILIGNTSKATAVILSYSPGGSTIYDTLNVNMLTPGFFVPGETLDYAESVGIQQVTIRVEAGIYYEDYPIRLAQNVTVKGDDFRRTIIRPIDRPSKSPWVSLFFYRDGIFDGMQIGPIDYSTDFGVGYNSAITLSASTGTITATLATGQVPASWIGLVLTQDTYKITQGTVFNLNLNQYCSINFVSSTGTALSSNSVPYKTGDNIVIEGMSPTNYNGTFTVATCTVGASTTTGSISGTTFSVGSGTVIGAFAIGQTLSGGSISAGTIIVAAGPTSNTWIVNNSQTQNSTTVTATGVGTVTFINNQAVGTATSYGQIATGKAVIDSVSGNVMNCTVVYPFSNIGPFAYGVWHLYTTSNYGRHYLTNPLDINSVPKNNKQIDVFLCNDATRISNISAQGHGGFMMVLDPEGQIKSKSPYGQESGCFTGSTNKKNFAGGQLIDGMTGRLYGTVVNIDAYPPNASATQCTISGNTLTVGGTIKGVFVLGMTISGSGIVNNPYIQSQISGTTGGTGTYQISSIQTVSSPETVIGSNGSANTLITVQGTVNSGLDVRPPQVPCSFYLQGYRYQIDEVYDYNGNATIGTVTYTNANSDGAVGTFTMTVTSTIGITAGMYISGTGIPTNASPAVFISSISGNTITLSNTNFVNGVAWTGLTAQASGTYTIGAPQTRLILDTSTPFATATSYSQISSYFNNIFDAVTYDAALGTTSQTIRTGLVYIQPENIVNGLTQVLLNIGINYINNRIAAITSPSAIGSNYKTAVTNNLALIYGIINNGITALPKPSNINYPAPLSSATTDQQNAVALLKANRTFIQQEVAAWLSALPQFSLQTTTGYSPLTTQQDLGYIVDAVIYDTLYGGNSQINQLATQYFWWTDGVYYYNSLTGKTVQNPDISRNTVLNVYYTAFEYLESVMENVIQGITTGTITINGSTTTYPSAGNGVIQNTTLKIGASYPNGSSFPVTNIETLVNWLSTYWTASKATRDTWASTQTITKPTISSSTSSYNADFSSITSNRSTILNTTIPNYLISGNVPINIEMGGNKSMLANDFTQVCDLGYGIVATNAGLTEQVSTFTYYNHVGYYSLNGGQIRSVAGSNGYGDYGLRASGADSTELPNAVNLVHDLIQTARVYKQGQYASEMGTPGTTIYTKIYIIGYEYIPYAQSYIDIDHSVEGGGIVTYQVNGISHTSVTIGQNVLQLTITSSTGLAFALRDGQLVTLRTNTYVEFTNITNVKPVRPSTALQYSANLSSIYRVLSYNLNQATGEAMSTPTNAILQTANGFAYYTFVPDTTNIVSADPTYSIATASVSSFASNTLSLTGITGTISIGQVVGNTISSALDITNGQATGYIYPAGLTVTYVSGGTVVLSGAITIATGKLSFGTVTQGANPGDNNIAVGVLTDQSTINQINTGNYSLAWNGRTHQVLSYQPPLYSASSTYSAFDSGTLTLTVNNVTGNILPGQLITGTGWTGQYVTAVQSIGVVPGGSTLQAILTISATVSGIVAGASIQFGFNINGYLQLALTPIYNNASIGIGLNGLEYLGSSLEPGSTQSELVTFKIPYSSAGTLPPVDSTINVAGYSVTTKITGYISGTTLTVSSVANTGNEQTLFAGMILTATSGGTILSGTTIVSNISGTGAGSTWTVSQSQTVASSGSPASITATNLSYDAKVQVTNVVNTTNITTNDVSKLVVGMVVSLVQTTGYVLSVSSNSITLTIPTNSDGSNQAPLYVGQQITFNTSSATTFGGISTSTAVTTNGITTYQSTYFVTYVSSNIIKVSVNPTLTPLISGTASGGYVSITGSISGNVLTVTVGSGIVAGMLIFSSLGGVTAGTYIQAFGTNGTSGTGGLGTYSLSVTQSSNVTSGTLSLSSMSFTTGGGNVPSGTIVQSVNTLTNSFVVSPACWIPNGATVSCIEYAYVTKVIVTNKGSGYTTAPVLTFSGGGASSQAIATVSIDPTTGSINNTVTIVSQGYGYTSAPTIALSSLTGSVTQTISGTNLITINSTAGLSSGASIIFNGIAGSFANTVYSITLNGSIAAGTGSYSGFGVATITGTTGTVYNNMTLSSGTSIATGTTIVNQISGVSGNLQATTTVASGGTSGTNTFVVTSATGIAAGLLVVGTGVPVGTYVKSNYTSGTTVTLVNINGNAANFTTNATGSYSFYTPNNAGTYLVSVSQAVSTITGIIGTVGGLSSTQTYTINQVIGATQISVFIYGSTTSPILGNSIVFTNNSLGFSVPGNAVLTAQISQFANPSVTTTGGTSTVQLTALYANGPGVFGTMTQTAILNNAVTVSSVNGITVGQQIIFTGTAFGNIVAGTTYYVASILSTTSPYTITISQSSTLSPVVVPSTTTTSSGSMQFYCPNFIDQPTTTVSSYGTKALSNGQFNVTLNLSGNITVTNGKYYNVSGNNNNLYNGIWACASSGSNSTNLIILTYPYDPGAWDSSLTTTVGILQAYASGSAIGISKGLSTSLSTTLFAGYSANTGAQITQRISLTRATGHDFAFIGTGGYNTSNYPNQIYGNPAIAADNTKQILEEGVGRCFYVTTDENGIFRVGKFFTVDQGTGTVSISQNVAFTNVSGLQFQRGVLVTDFSSDSKMTENASDIVPVQSAIRSFIDYRLGLAYGGDPVPNYNLIGPGYMALNGALAMTGQMNLGGNGIINMNMPVNVSPTNATNKGYVDTQDTNQNSIFKLQDSTLPYSTGTARIGDWTGGVSLAFTPKITATVNNPPTIGMYIYGGGTRTIGQVTTYAFDGTQQITAVTLTTTSGGELIANITLSQVPNFTPIGVVVFTSIVTGSQLVYDAPSSTWKAAILSVPSSGPIATTGVSTNNGVATFTFASQATQPFQAGQTIVISGTTNNSVSTQSYNGIWTVLATPAPTTTSVSIATSSTGAITTQGTIIGNTTGLTYNSASGTITTSINSGSIVDSMVGATAAIQQSKLLMQNAVTSANAPSGLQSVVQAASGLASFNSAVFTANNGWIDLKTATSNATGIQLGKITYIPAGTILYNNTGAAASPSAITPANLVADGNAISNSSFAGSVGVMTVTANANTTSPGGVTNTGGGNSYDVVQVSQANAVATGTGGLNQHQPNSFIKSGSDGSVDVGILQVQGTPIITATPSNPTAQLTFGFPSAASVNTASFTGGISSGTSGGNLVISSAITGIIAIGMALTGTGVTAGTVIIGGSGNSWTVFPSQTVANGTIFTATLSPSGVPGFMVVGLNASNAVVTTFLGQTFAPIHQASTFEGIGGQTISASYNGGWTISGSTQLSSNSSFTVGNSSGGSATTLYGTLNTYNSITLNGGAGKLFTITNGSGTPVTQFSVDSNTGNTSVTGSFFVNTNKFSVDSTTGNTTIAGNLVVQGTTITVNSETVNNNETITGTLAVSSTTDAADTGSGAMTVAGGVGIAKKLYVGSNLSVTGTGTLSVNSGSTSLGGTLSVTGDTSITSTNSTALTVTGGATFNSNVTLAGSTTAATEYFKVTAGPAGATTFAIDSAQGNTTIGTSGTLTLAAIAANGAGTPATGTITGAWSTSTNSSLNLATNNSTLFVKTINATNSGTSGSITGLWTFNNATTFSDSVTLIGSTTANAKFFKITDGTTQHFYIDSSTGSITSTGNITLTGTSNTITLSGTNARVVSNVTGSVYAVDGTTLLLDATNKALTNTTLSAGLITSGTLSADRGGTGASGAQAGIKALLNGLPTTPATGYFLASNGSDSYFWASPTSISQTNVGTRITTTRKTWKVGINGVTAGQTSFTDVPSYATGQGNLRVYLNGVRQDDGNNDYSEVSSTSFTLGVGLQSGDVLFAEIDANYSYVVNANNVVFSSINGVSNTDVQGAIATLQGNKMPYTGGQFTGDVSTAGAVNITLGAGTASKAPLKFTDGTLISSPISGTIEYNSGYLYYTDNANTPVRQTVASQSWVNTTLSTFSSGGSLDAGTLKTGTIPSTTLGNSTVYVGTTGIALNRTSANLGLTGITSIAMPGSTSGTITLQPTASAGTTTITFPATTGTVAMSGDTFYIGSTQIANNRGNGSIALTGITSIDGKAGTASTADTANALNTSNAYRVNALGVNVDPSSFTTGEIRASNNITAYYSDDRLKTRIGGIENALDKLCSLEGFYYEANETAQALGYEVKKEVGLSAQSVQKVLPEIVAPAPIDDKYLTIRYERIAPLVVEAIKELRKEISDIKKHLGL